MKKHLTSTLLALCLMTLISSSVAAGKPPSLRFRNGLFGITPGTTRARVHDRLNDTGTLLREEGKRQEVWELRDQRFSGAIAAYDEEWRVRFITFVAREDGQRLRYTDVMDLNTAEHRSAGASHTYTWRPRHARYIVIARGTDSELLTYLTFRGTTAGREEKEDD